ncbi:MAG TPA: type II toxin-antitoxin system VapC family toxin [Solirubrobacterales bacterium]|nr:type II toxin-antitoxin system VapC family toxin [Solirubrobacterales bacterium]
MILLDTHVLVWLAGARERLSTTAEEAIESDQELAISVASVQEIAYLVARGRLVMDRPVETWIGDALNVHEVRALAPTVSAALRAGSLDPVEFHGDPVDRLIYATAVEHDARLISADGRLRSSDPTRVVW